MAAAKERQADFSFETVAVLCSAIISEGGSIGTRLYEHMSALDGKRSVNSFQHQFRAVLKRARELKALRDEGAEVKPADPKYKRTNGKAKAETAPKGGSKKREREVKDEDGVSVGEDEAVVGAETPTKKVKTEPAAYQFNFDDSA